VVSTPEEALAVEAAADEVGETMTLGRSPVGAAAEV
jgi:hypothetical protein